MRIHEHTLKHWAELIDFDRDANPPGDEPGAAESSSYRPRIYRGQADAEWQLSSSFERFCAHNGIAPGQRRGFEDRLWREFRRGYHQYTTSAPSTENRLEWASVMQHHGSPTRLLDFTYSIFVAAYFALEATTAECAAIWSIDARWASRESKNALRKAGKREVDDLSSLGVERDEAPISGLIFDNSVRMAWPVNPFRLNERLRVQKGTFLVAGDVEASHMENLTSLSGHDQPERVIKIVIPKRMRSDALRQLFHMNISRTSLFPGLDGYAASLGVYHPTVFHPIPWNDPESA